MCGIVGYIGKQQALPILLDGLEKLEYRGYDSTGVAIYDKNKIVIKKSKGRLEELKKSISSPIKGNIGIGHTRWATHGKPSDINSHPHTNEDNTFALVHNGIIENFLELKDFLIKDGHLFKSDTDTEVLAHLLQTNYTDDIKKAITETLKSVSGSYALGIICKDSPKTLYAVRKDSPLVIGISEKGNYLASDVTAFSNYTDKVIYLDDYEIAEIKESGVTIYDFKNNIINKTIQKIDSDSSKAEKGYYDHFMMKEIMEQPDVFDKTINMYTKDNQITFDDLNIDFNKVKHIQFIACGSAYYAGWIGKYVIEKLLNIPVEMCIASEYRYNPPVTHKKTLAITISQSGETADTLAALKKAKTLGAKTLSIVNVKGSSIARDADNVIYTSAGIEIAVATTKAYISQLAVIYMLAFHIAEKTKTMDKNILSQYVTELKTLSLKIKSILDTKDEINKIARNHTVFSNIFFIGRGLDYAVCMEGSLKLKEISYIPSEAYPAGELKHGTISLVENGTLIVAAATQDELLPKMLNNIEEVKTRGAKIILITKEKHQSIDCEADILLHIPECNNLFTPALSVVIFQLFSYYVALYKGCDIDKPRNLAKSVTVE